MPDSNKSDRNSYIYGQEGHIKMDCKKKDTKSSGRGVNQNQSNRKARPAPKFKKYHCAYHKDTLGHFCSTWSCPSLRYTAYSDIIKLLREKLDCETCCLANVLPKLNRYVEETRTVEVLV